MFLFVMRVFVNMMMIFFEDNEDVWGCVVCEGHLNKSSIAGLRPFQNCRQVL